MLTKNDLILLLAELQAAGEPVDNYITQVATSKTISLDALKFINSKRPLAICEFYELLRKNNNNKKSNLYKNIMKDDYKSSDDALTTLSALLLQINLFASHLEDDRLFLKHSRASDITKVLSGYYDTYNLLPCYQALKAVRADILAFEFIEGRRNY